MLHRHRRAGRSSSTPGRRSGHDRRMADPSVVATGIRSLGREALALLLSATCPGCAEPGTLLCDPCRGRLEASPVDVRTPQGRVVRAALTYEGVAARCIRRMKDDGETLLTRPLGIALAAVLVSVAGSDVSVVPVPTSRAAYRRRGYRVPELLIRRAGVRPLRALSASRARPTSAGSTSQRVRAMPRGACERAFPGWEPVSSWSTMSSPRARPSMRQRPCSNGRASRWWRRSLWRPPLFTGGTADSHPIHRRHGGSDP